MKRIICFLVSVVLLMSFVGCSTDSGTQKLKLLTSFYPIYIIALNITDGVDGVVVDSLASQDVGCLHDFQLQSSDMKNVESADVFIINGAGMESFLDKVISELPNLKIIDSSKGIELIKNDGDDEEGEYNAHLWVSISNYIQQVKNISEGIIAADPENSEKYKSNTQEYISKLEKLRDEMHEALDDLSIRDIITFHEAFPYFAKEFNLNIAGVINREPNTEPDAKELAETIDLVKRTGIKALFVEPQYSKTTANTIANETNAKVYMLDPAVSGDMDKDAYIRTMEKNKEVLVEALK